MKNFLKVLGLVLLVPYVIVAIIVTVCLLNYNEYGVTEIGNKTYITVDKKLICWLYIKEQSNTEL